MSTGDDTAYTPMKLAANKLWKFARQHLLGQTRGMLHTQTYVLSENPLLHFHLLAVRDVRPAYGIYVVCNNPQLPENNTSIKPCHGGFLFGPNLTMAVMQYATHYFSTHHRLAPTTFQEGLGVLVTPPPKPIDINIHDPVLNQHLTVINQNLDRLIDNAQDQAHAPAAVPHGQAFYQDAPISAAQP